jgi:UDP-glucose 4-epimerase
MQILSCTWLQHLGVNTILESPLESMSTNITGSEVVLNAAAKFNKRIIIASTSEIYGKNPSNHYLKTMIE